MPSKGFYVNRHIKKNNGDYEKPTHNKESDDLIDIKKRFALATKHLVSGYSGSFIKYPLIDKYANSVASDHILDFASVILEQNPYNDSNIPLDVNALSETDKISYINHLKSYMRREQHGVNDEWLPDGKATYASGLRSSAIADIAVPSNGKIIEIWLITKDDEIKQQRLENILEIGYNCPIYKLNAYWLKRKDIIDVKDPIELYKLARANSKQINYKLDKLDIPIVITQKSDQLIAKETFVNYITKELFVYSTCIDYSIIHNTIKIDIALDYDGSIKELWKIVDNDSYFNVDIIDSLKKNRYNIPIYEIKGSWINENKGDEYLYANAKKNAIKWN
jgi:hypothetical protein